MTTKRLLAALAVVAISAAAPAAFAHAKLQASQPAASSELASSPKEIRLQFNERLVPAFSKIELLEAKDALLPLPKIEFGKADSKSMFATVPPITAWLVPGPLVGHGARRPQATRRIRMPGQIGWRSLCRSPS
jgi:methionine-rich copper-binding protein CopC